MKTINKFKILNYFRPSLFVNNISEIVVDNLYDRGFRMIICDLDNTLVPHFTKTPTSMAINFMNAVKKQGLIFIVASNNTKKRVTKFCKILQPDDFIYNAKKPFTGKIKKILAKYKMDSSDVLFVGDQIITDIWVSNRLQAKSILTLPLVDSTNPGNNFLLNFIENNIYSYLQNKNLLNNKKEIEDAKEYEIL